MRQFRLALLFLLFSVISPAQDQPASAISFKVLQGHFILVDGSLGNLTHRNLIVDTGVNPTMIDTAVAQELGLPGQPRSIHALMYDIDTLDMSLPGITIGPIHVDDVPVVAGDLSEIGSRLGIRVDALVGLDVLKRRSFTIRYSDNKIVFGTPLRKAGLPLLHEMDRAIVEVSVGNLPARMLIDTGAADIILFRNRIDIFSRASAVQHNRMNLGGTLSMTRVPLPTVRLGDTELNYDRAFLVEDPSPPDNIDGLFGVSARFIDWIAFDFEQRLFSWQLRDSRIPPITEAGSAPCLAGDPGSMSRDPAGFLTGRRLLCSVPDSAAVGSRDRRR